MSLTSASMSISDIEKVDPETGEIITTNLRGGGVKVAEGDFDLLEKYAGVGYSHEAEDGLTPILAILQDNSGECKKNHERHLDNAESGMMIIRSLRSLYEGSRGILVQPFGFNHVYVEWTGEIGEGTPVGRFSFYDPPADMYETPDPKDPRRKMIRRKDTGNRLVDTREHLVNLFDGENAPFPVVVPMSGSNHSTSRLWTNMMRNMIYNGRKLPSFFRLYRLKTAFRKRGQNQTWYSYTIDPDMFVRDRDILQLGADSYEMAKEKPLEGDLADLGTDLDDVAATSAYPDTRPQTSAAEAAAVI